MTVKTLATTDHPSGRRPPRNTYVTEKNSDRDHLLGRRSPTRAHSAVVARSFFFLFFLFFFFLFTTRSLVFTTRHTADHPSTCCREESRAIWHSSGGHRSREPPPEPRPITENSADFRGFRAPLRLCRDDDDDDGDRDDGGRGRRVTLARPYRDAWQRRSDTRITSDRHRPLDSSLNRFSRHCFPSLFFSPLAYLYPSRRYSQTDGRHLAFCGNRQRNGPEWRDRHGTAGGASGAGVTRRAGDGAAARAPRTGGTRRKRTGRICVMRARFPIALCDALLTSDRFDYANFHTRLISE